MLRYARFKEEVSRYINISIYFIMAILLQSYVCNLFTDTYVGNWSNDMS